MHELSVAMEICRLAEARLAEVGCMDGMAGALVALGIDVGDAAGVEADNLVFCLEALLAAAPFSGARVELHRAPGDVLQLSYLEIDDGRPDD